MSTYIRYYIEGILGAVSDLKVRVPLLSTITMNIYNHQVDLALRL